MMFDRRLIENFDWGLLALTIVISGVGLGVLYSAVTAGGTATEQMLYYKQIVWLCLGGVVMIACLMINYRTLENWSGGIYVICILLLILVLFVGKIGGGSRRWLAMGPITMQPSELIKIGMILVLAKYYAANADTRGLNMQGLFKPALITGIPCALIIMQPDLGTAILLTLIAASMTFFIKIERRLLVYMGGLGFLTGFPVWFFLLKNYQKQRILTFLNPDRDPLGAGYHIIQSRIAIGSGMLTGKGYLKGTQNTLEFLPEQHTDFIMSVLAEEWGLAGAGFVLMLYMFLLIWGLNIAHKSRDPFAIMLAVGITVMLFWEAFINIGMIMGLMPVVGVPLPLISYGGSSVLTTMIGIGLLMGISMRRYIKK